MSFNDKTTASDGGSLTRHKKYPPAAVLIMMASVLCLLPLLVTPVLPLIDFYAHIARYFALGHAAQDPWIAENYKPLWRLLPNLGLDALGTGIMMVFPPLLGAKVIAALIILAPFVGSLSLAKVVHGRIAPLHVALAGLLTYSFILAWGFSNFLFGLGIAMGATAVWIATTFQPRLQLVTGMVFGVVIMLVHGLVFGLWGLMLFWVEVMLVRQAMPLSIPNIAWRILRLGVLTILPLVIFFQTKTAGAEGGVTNAIANFGGYIENGQMWPRLIEELWQRGDSFLRVAESSYPVLDRLFGVLLWGSLAAGFVTRRFTLDQRLRAAVVFFALMVVIMPPNLFGVGHLDERIPLILLALIAAGIKTQPMAPSSSQRIQTFFGLLFVVHIAMVSIGWAKGAKEYDKFLTATEKLDQGGLAQTQFFGETKQRDKGRFCKSLLFLILLQKGSAVPTFANPTQQPIEITGPLARSLEAQRIHKETLPESHDAVSLEALKKSGFRTVVTCDDPQLAPVHGQTHLVAKGRSWSLYQMP